MKNQTASSEYKYIPLPRGDYFRLLVLEPGAKEDDLVASMRAAELQNIKETKNSFEAISYVWGSNTKDQVIIIDGSQVFITTNLRNSLRQVRYEDKPRTVWADSICIDQQNIEEKSHQVGAMGRIYQSSECTLMCFGSEPEFQQLATDAATLINEVSEMMRCVLDDLDSSVNWDKFRHPDADDPLVNDPRWGSWGVLLDRPWFSRGWVVQEAALGPDARIIWAGVEIPWLSLLQVYTWLAYRASPKMRLTQQVKFLSPLHMLKFKIERSDVDKAFWPQDAVSRVGTFPALELLDYARELTITDPRDRIYAFVGLSTKDDIMQTIRPDYNAQFLDVYRNFATTYLEQTSDLDLLLYVEKPFSEQAFSPQTKLPSWVPRWDEGKGINSRLFICGRRIGTCTFDLKGHVLQVRAVILGTVRYISERIKPLTENSDAFGQVLTLWRHLREWELSTYYPKLHPHQGRLGLAFIQALNCGIYDGDLEEWVESLEKIARILECDLKGIAQTRLSIESFRTKEAVERISTFAVNISKNRHIVVLGQGNYGLAPNAIQPGDICAIVYGTSWPFILREVSGRRDHYKIVGPVYLLSQKQDEFGLPDRMGCSETCEDWKNWNLIDQEIFII